MFRPLDGVRVEGRLSVGAYAFVTRDYHEMDYPLDLWLIYHLSVFDQIAVVKYGEFELPLSDARIISETISSPEFDTYQFYRRGKQKAQDALGTEWKVLLDIDEFLDKAIETSGLDRSLAYPLVYRHLFGNLHTEIRNNGFPHAAKRVHFGRREVIGDGASVAGPWSSRPVGQFWHTGAVRRPSALSQKWQLQIVREINEGYTTNDSRLGFLKEPFDYRAYKAIWPSSFLLGIREELPSILRENAKRFDWCKFDDLAGEGSLTERYLSLKARLRNGIARRTKKR